MLMSFMSGNSRENMAVLASPSTITGSPSFHHHQNVSIHMKNYRECIVPGRDCAPGHALDAQGHAPGRRTMLQRRRSSPRRGPLAPRVPRRRERSGRTCPIAAVTDLQRTAVRRPPFSRSGDGLVDGLSNVHILLSPAAWRPIAGITVIVAETSSLPAHHQPT